MDTKLPGFEPLMDQLAQLERAQKPKMLVVDDEPDNLDLLFRTFRRSFQVLKAESGVRALQILAQEGEVAVIISDQRMPEMKGTEFLSKTVPQFPNTVRIILTGFTDVEDLVEAINSGQVYKYITKPWDPSELKSVVQNATDQYHLQKTRAEELAQAHTQASLLTAIVEAAGSVGSLSELLPAIANIIGKGFHATGCILHALRDDGQLSDEYGVYSPDDTLTQSWLAEDPLTQRAIASQTLELVINVPQDPELATLPHYQTLHTHLVVPISFQDTGLAIMSMQWGSICPLRPATLPMLYLIIQQIALTLSCTCVNH